MNVKEQIKNYIDSQSASGKTQRHAGVAQAHFKSDAKGQIMVPGWKR